MRTTVSSKLTYLLIFVIIIGVFVLSQLIMISRYDNPLIIFLLLIPFFLLMLYEFLRTRMISYDEQFIYLNGLTKEQRLDYSSVMKVKRQLMRSYRFSTLNLGYKLVYRNEYGNVQSCIFYVPLTKSLLWDSFIKTLSVRNPEVEITEKLF